MKRRLKEDVPVTPVPERRQIGFLADAEENAAAWMRHWGFNHAATTLPERTRGSTSSPSRLRPGEVRGESDWPASATASRRRGGPYQEKALLFFAGTDSRLRRSVRRRDAHRALSLCAGRPHGGSESQCRTHRLSTERGTTPRKRPWVRGGPRPKNCVRPALTCEAMETLLGSSPAEWCTTVIRR